MWPDNSNAKPTGRRPAVPGPGLLLRRHPARGERERRRVVAGAEGAAQRGGGRRAGRGALQAAVGEEDGQEEQGRRSSFIGYAFIY